MKNKIIFVLKIFAIVSILPLLRLVLRFINLPSRVNFSIYSIIFFLYLTILLAGFISLIIILVDFFRKKKSKKIIIVCAIALPSLIISSILFFRLSFELPISQRLFPSGSDLSNFSSEFWQQNASTAWNNGISEREKMLKDLVENVLPGKSKDEIEQLLGESLDTPYFRSIDKDMIYYLGPQRDSLGVDSEWLLIWLDEEGYFTKYRIVND